MKSFLNWLTSLLRVETVWIDKGQGRWVRRRRFHPFTRIVVVVTVLTLGISWGVNYFHSAGKTSRAPEKGPISRPLLDPVATLPEPSIRDPRPTDFFPESENSAVQPEPLPGPIPDNLEPEEDEYWVRIDKGLYRLFLYRGREIDRIYTVGVGKNPGDKERAGDNRTPNGIFTVQSIENSSGWTHDFRDGKGIIRGAYGPWFIRLRTGWKGIGIHGTHDPDSRGTMVSEGCIRMLNSELEELKQFAFRDMKVVIEE